MKPPCTYLAIFSSILSSMFSCTHVGRRIMIYHAKANVLSSHRNPVPSKSRLKLCVLERTSGVLLLMLWVVGVGDWWSTTKKSWMSTIKNKERTREYPIYFR